MAGFGRLTYQSNARPARFLSISSLSPFRIDSAFARHSHPESYFTARGGSVGAGVCVFAYGLANGIRSLGAAGVDRYVAGLDLDAGSPAFPPPAIRARRAHSHDGNLDRYPDGGSLLVYR